MSAPGFLIVHPDVASNPVARAIARARLHASVQTFATRLYLLQEGEAVEADGTAAARVLYVAYLLLDGRGQGGDPPARVIRGAISALEQLALRGWTWHTRDATAVDQALEHARAAVDAAKAADVQRAWAELYRIDARISAERTAYAAGRGAGVGVE